MVVAGDGTRRPSEDALRAARRPSEDALVTERGALNALRAASLEAEKALRSVPQVAPDASESRLVALRARLAELGAAEGAVGRRRAAQVRARNDAKARYSQARAGAQERREVQRAAEQAAQRAREAKDGAEDRAGKLTSQIAELEALLQQLRHARARAVDEVRELEEEELQQIRRAEEANAEAARLEVVAQQTTAGVAEAAMEIAAFDAALADMVAALAAIETALPARRREYERQFQSWSVEEVVSWVQSLEGGRFTLHAEEFRCQGITGELLATLTHEEFVALGVRDLRARRALLAAVDELRGIAEDNTPEPPEELLCPITQELVEDPVVIVGDVQGHAYERWAIEQWFREGHSTVPATNQDLDDDDRQLLPLRALARQAHEWRLTRSAGGKSARRHPPTSSRAGSRVRAGSPSMFV